MIINKIYYILPIIFISFLIKKFIAVTCFLEKLDNLQLYSIFYTKVISKEQFIITYENGVTVESHEIDAINKRLALIWEPEKPRSYYLGYTEILKEGLFLLFFSLSFLIYIIKTTNITFEFLIFKQSIIIPSIVLFTILIIIQISFWLYIKNSLIIKYFFWLITLLNILLFS